MNGEEDDVIAESRHHPDVEKWGRVVAVAYTAAGVLILAAVLFPSPADPADYQSFLALLVENLTRTRTVLLAVPVGVWALAAGVEATYRMNGGDAGTVGLRLGSHGVLIGAAVITVQFALGTAALTESSRGGVELGETLWAGATYVRSFGMLILWLGLAALGVGLVASRKHPRVLGWPAILFGFAMAGVSGATILAGPTKAAAMASGGLAGLTAIWSVVLGVWHWRRHQSPQ